MSADESAAASGRDRVDQRFRTSRMNGRSRSAARGRERRRHQSAKACVLVALGRQMLLLLTLEESCRVMPISSGMRADALCQRLSRSTAMMSS